MKREHNRNHDGAWLGERRSPEPYEPAPGPYLEEENHSGKRKGGVKIRKPKRKREHILGRFFLTLILMLALLAGLFYAAFCAIQFAL